MSAVASNDEIYRAIGKLEATVDGLRRDIQQSEMRGDSHRADIHKRVDDIAVEIKAVKVEAVKVKAAVATVIENMDTVKGDLASTKEISDEVRAWKQRGIGALFVVGIGASAITFALAKYWTQIIGWLADR